MSSGEADAVKTVSHEIKTDRTGKPEYRIVHKIEDVKRCPYCKGKS